MKLAWRMGPRVDIISSTHGLVSGQWTCISWAPDLDDKSLFGPTPQKHRGHGLNKSKGPCLWPTFLLADLPSSGDGSDGSGRTVQMLGIFCRLPPTGGQSRQYLARPASQFRPSQAVALSSARARVFEKKEWTHASRPSASNAQASPNNHQREPTSPPVRGCHIRRSLVYIASPTASSQAFTLSACTESPRRAG